MSSISDRLLKLRSLRANLCKKSSTWSEAFEARDWFIASIKEVIKEGKEADTTKEQIINKLEDFICVIEPDEDNENDK